MKVIMLADVKGVGKKDQIIEASLGHARNFLLPKKLALEATKENINAFEAKKRAEEQKRIRAVEDAQARKARLEAANVTVKVKVGENGKMFGSVTNKEVADALRAQENIDLDKKNITVSDPIKTVGEHTVTVKLLGDINVKLKITVEG